jgi:hypothetical protein
MDWEFCVSYVVSPIVAFQLTFCAAIAMFICAWRKGWFL